MPEPNFVPFLRTPRCGLSLFGGIVVLMIAGLTSDADAHAVDENYLFINVREDHIEGHFELPFDDIRKKLGMRVPKNMDRARKAIKENAVFLQEYIRENFSIGPVDGEPYELIFTHEDVTPAVGGFAQLYVRMDTGPIPDRLEVNHTMFFDGDRLHRFLLCMDYNSKTDRSYGGEYTALVFSPSNTRQFLDLVAVPGLLTEEEMRAAGTWRNVTGIFHFLFVFAFLVSAVLVRGEDGNWKPAQRFLFCLGRFVLLVAAYAGAHILTFWLSVHDKLFMGETLVMVVVALSVVLLAYRNFRAQGFVGTLPLVFFLGAFHGLAIAASLDYLAMRLIDIEAMSKSFFWGFEWGYILLAVILFGIFFALRRRSFYQSVILRGGSAAAALVALVWLAVVTIR